MTPLAAHYKAVRARMGMAPQSVAVPFERVALKSKSPPPPTPAQAVLESDRAALEAAIKTGSEIKSILLASGTHLHVPFVKIIGGDRHKSAYWARHIAFYLCRKHTKHTLPAIGKICRRDHTSVLNGVGRVADLVARGDAKTLADLAAVEELLGIGKGREDAPAR